jgi:uncharacterized circularly permuted ATP-grasp superfamily protein
MKFEPVLAGTNEVFSAEGAPRPPYGAVLDELERLGPRAWKDRLALAHRLLLDEQHAFGIADGDRTHPTDWIPRIVAAAEWERLERGLVQRARAINHFLRAFERGTDDVVPKDVIETSVLYDPATVNRFGGVPVRQIAFDVVAVETAGGWDYVVLEENAKMPVGLAPMTRRRTMTSAVVFPASYADLPVRSLDGCLRRLGASLRAASPRGDDATLAVVSGGPADQFYLDHHIYAAEMDAVLSETEDLAFDGDGYLRHRRSGRRIDVVYERVDEDRLYADLPELAQCHASGKVQVCFAPNSEIIDDKGVYLFVPDMIRTYLGEEPLIPNAESWSLAVEDDRRYVMDHFDELVVKSRSGYGGKEVMIGPERTPAGVEQFRRIVEADPVEYIAQRMVDFSTHVLCDVTDDDFVLRDSYTDYRIIALAPDPTDPDVVEIVPGCLSRVASPGSHLTNISSGGKMKDTWVLEPSTPACRT